MLVIYFAAGSFSFTLALAGSKALMPQWPKVNHRVCHWETKEAGGICEKRLQEAKHSVDGDDSRLCSESSVKGSRAEPKTIFTHLELISPDL